MTAEPRLPPPAFGQADLSNCEREQIHLAGSIQPHGALLVCDDRLEVLQASANAAALLGVQTLLGTPLDAVGGDLAERVRRHAPANRGTLPHVVRCEAGDATPLDAIVHRSDDGAGIVVELEPAGPAGFDVAPRLEQALEAIAAAPALQTVCDETARLFRELTGYDRVMVYRFDDEGHGEVFAERRRAELESYLGNWYPASDIPHIARRLYERNRLRMLVDVDYEPVPVEPVVSPVTGAAIDMSMCFLRSMSPIHLQYLRNMGVRATLVASLMVGGRLWGLVSCHHYSERHLPYETRGVCEILSEAVATRIAALESFVQAQAEMAVRRIEQRMVEAISRDGDWRAALLDSPQTLLGPLEASGAALLFDDEVLTVGEVPGTSELREIGAWLDGRRRSGGDAGSRAEPIATASLGTASPRFRHLAPVVSGVVAVPVSNAPGEYLVWLRPERVRSVTWGGKPEKPKALGPDGLLHLSPRQSFAKWHQLVEGSSEPWSTAELTAARLIGQSVADVVLQFRAVRLLLTRDQLERVGRQVRASEIAMLIAGPDGEILVTNEPLDRLLQRTRPAPASLDALAALFTDADLARRHLDEMLARRRPWRAELALADDPDRPLMVRADPVESAGGRLLGAVLLVTELAEQRAAERARRHFQQDLLESGARGASAPLDSAGDLAYRNLLATVVSNAQLAALEITDGVELAQMPEMLQSVHGSVRRTAEILRYLLSHAGGTPDDPDPPG